MKTLRVSLHNQEEKHHKQGKDSQVRDCLYGHSCECNILLMQVVNQLNFRLTQALVRIMECCWFQVIELCCD